MGEQQIFAKCAWRLLPLIIAAYIINYLDRTNVGFAALTMNKDLGFSPSVYGLGAGIFFISYSLFQVPSNLILHKVGARRWIFCILACWGAASAASALIRDPWSFYALRFLLGIGEAGFFPAVIVYLTFWFPKAWLGRVTAAFMASAPVSLIFGGPLASLIVGLDGLAGVRGWQWLFLLEGLPACFIAFAVLKLLPDRPACASWLAESEKRFIDAHIDSQENQKDQNLIRALCDPRVFCLGIAYSGLLFATYGFNFWLPLLIQGTGFSNTATGFVTALVYLAGVPAMMLWSRSSDRMGERVWHAALAAILAAIGVLVASIAQSTLLLLVALALGYVGMSSMLAPFYTLPSLFLSGPAMAGGFALVSTIGNLLGGFAGQYLIGLIREQTGSYGPVLVAVSAALLSSALIVLGLARSIAPRTTSAAAVGA